MRTKVRPYSNKQLVEQVSALPSFKGFPKGYWILGVQSNEDTYNEFDDKFYLFKGKQFITVTSGTTNAGTTGLKHYDRYNPKGVAVIKTNEWYYDLWRPGYHRGRMRALKQNKPIKYFRDWNKNKKIEEIGKLYKGIIGINFHTVTYQNTLSFWRRYINGWSTGCQVVNHVSKYYWILDRVWNQKTITYCLIKEFDA